MALLLRVRVRRQIRARAGFHPVQTTALWLKSVFPVPSCLLRFNLFQPLIHELKIHHYAESMKYQVLTMPLSHQSDPFSLQVISCQKQARALANELTS